jgi:hypothetical protein
LGTTGCGQRITWWMAVSPRTATSSGLMPAASNCGVRRRRGSPAPILTRRGLTTSLGWRTGGGADGERAGQSPLQGTLEGRMAQCLSAPHGARSAARAG